MANKNLRNRIVDALAGKPAFNLEGATALAETLAVDLRHDRKIRAAIEGDRIVFTGGRFGAHSIALPVSSRARIVAHFVGYLVANGFVEPQVNDTVRFRSRSAYRSGGSRFGKVVQRTAGRVLVAYKFYSGKQAAPIWLPVWKVDVQRRATPVTPVPVPTHGFVATVPVMTDQGGVLVGRSPAGVDYVVYPRSATESRESLLTRASAMRERLASPERGGAPGTPEPPNRGAGGRASRSGSAARRGHPGADRVRRAASAREGRVMAFPTETDLRFYEAKHVPRWAAPLIKARAKRPGAELLPALIDDVVNAHGGERMTSGECAVHNLLGIVRSYRRRGLDLEQRLSELAREPGCLINPEKRASFARKWARRMQEQRA
jgi:hypothetical protein